MMNSAIIHTDPDTEFNTDERCHILEILNRPDQPSFSIARARVEPGITTALHALKGTDEIYYILEGEGRMEVGEHLGKVARGDVVIIPGGVSQRITNIGQGDLLFLCICSPRFESEAYSDLEA